MSLLCLLAIVVGVWFLSSSNTLLRLEVPAVAANHALRAIVCFIAALCLSGCGMLVTINPIGMLGIVEHKSHSVPSLPCHPIRSATWSTRA
jgi:hypothetical protein